jgi:hypothetical protein
MIDQLPPGSVADFITLLSPRECLPHAFPDLTPRGWIVGNESAEWHFPLTIGPVAGHRPKHIPFQGADRPATPRTYDHEFEVAQESEIASPAPPSMLPAAPALPDIPYPVMAAQSVWSAGLEAAPAIGKLVPADAVSRWFFAAAPRLPTFRTLESNSPLALVPIIDSSPKLLTLHAADR